MKTIYIVKVFTGDTKDDYVVCMSTPKRDEAIAKTKRMIRDGVRCQYETVELSKGAY